MVGGLGVFVVGGLVFVVGGVDQSLDVFVVGGLGVSLDPLNTHQPQLSFALSLSFILSFSLALFFCLALSLFLFLSLSLSRCTQRGVPRKAQCEALPSCPCELLPHAYSSPSDTTCHVCACVCMCVHVCACVCMCVRQRETAHLKRRPQNEQACKRKRQREAECFTCVMDG